VHPRCLNSLTLFDGDHPLVSLPYLDASDGRPLGQITVESLPCTLVWEGNHHIRQLVQLTNQKRDG
jgi:hypothetical protein